MSEPAPAPDIERRPIESARGGRSRIPRRAAVGLVVVAVFCGLAWLGGSWWYARLLASAQRDVETGRFAEARETLARLARWWPRRAEVEYPLGVCAIETGRIDEAIAAWSRVPSSSPRAEDAARRRAQAEQDRGRFAAAEAVLLNALERPGKQAVQLRHDLLLLLWRQGRLEEVGALLERNWEQERRRSGADSASSLEFLRAHLALDLEAFPISRVRDLLEIAARAAPNDDRVWLGRARLALRTGDFDESKRWLERCLDVRRDDPAVWSTALDLATATLDLALVTESARHLSTTDVPAARVDHLRAWSAAQRGESDEEAAALRELLAREPADARALERLAELEIQAGHADRARELRHRKAEVDTTLRLYGKRVSTDFKAEALGLADQAETLGRRFEARAFLTLAFKLHPETVGLRERLARLEVSSAPRRSDRLIDLVGPLPSDARGKRATASSADLAFTDDAEAAGLRFRFENGRTPLHQLPETMSGGVGLLDVDGDGHLDVYAVQGGPFPPDPNAPNPGDRLFRNKGDGSFEDITDRSGIAGFARGYGHGVAVGDVDNDGHPDLFITRWRSYALYRNRGDGTFEDATKRFGLAGDRDWPTSAAFADLDGDGDLDLYVAHYITWDTSNPMVCRAKPDEPPSYCAPHLLPHAVDHLFRNDGGKFTDVTRASGVTDVDGRGLGVLTADLDEDGKVDVFVANDGTANFFFRNLGGFRFEEAALASGLAAGAEGGYQAGMGIACGDLDGDGRFDLVVTNFLGESTSVFKALGRGQFAEQTARVGLREPTRYLLGFGTALADVNNDGFLDLATANGHVNDVRPAYPYAMPAMLALGGPGGRLTDASAQAGAVWSTLRVGRGLAAGDLDNDGRVDFVVVDQAGPLAYFHNGSGEKRPSGHFVTFRLEGTASNRDAVGATVRLSAGGRSQVAQRFGGGSYQSSGDPRVHFGLGPERRVERVEVRWPSGRVDRYRDLAADTGYLLREGSEAARPLAEFRRPN